VFHEVPLRSLDPDRDSLVRETVAVGVTWSPEISEDCGSGCYLPKGWL
jgi:hypothetical protein